ncbi:phage holin family protein [Cohnella silvisoli]|uniref:Phage holin family protein n=1 Tax=Cohnella silvisoli TaxID=2873699 RepID=A0ABV1KYU1_9BACL|nr:phage holin family protein [Cohnella silvisoli]MCD9024301.1 phage holin family protein [Cohnella silvisoli]
MNGQSIINVSAGLLGAFITFAFGHWTEAMTFLLVVIAADIVSGISASIAEGTGVKSSIGRRGFANKGLMILVILVAHRADVLLGIDVVMGSAIYFYVANELLSVIENYGRAGLPLPDVVKRLVTVLREKGGVSDNGEIRGKPTDV